MIKAASLLTYEIDDISLACRELKSQLKDKLTLLKNTVGIVQCDPEYIEAGFLEILHNELNIPMAGGTTVTAATNESIGNSMFSILVLTSDSVEFSVSQTEGLSGDYTKAIESSLAPLVKDTVKPLKLAVIFPPMIENISGDNYLDVFESLCGKIPVFGTYPVDEDFPSYDRSYSVINNKASTRELSYVLFYGEVNPKFYTAAVPARTIITENETIITRAADNFVYELNHTPAAQYLENLGLAADGALKSGSNFLPLLVSLGEAENERPFVRALLGLDPAGYAICSGRMLEGARISFGSCRSEDVISATTESVSQAATEGEIQAALIFSCMVRQIVIGIDSMKELKKIKGLIPADIPFMASYSGGEFSPTNVDSHNIAQNRFHNYSLIMCLL